MNNLMLIIVLYNKKVSDLSLVRLHNNIKEMNLDIFIYDNSSESQCVPEVDGFNLYYFHDKNNSGVSKAYNMGIKKAKSLNKKYVILLDQDTSILASDLKNYLLLSQKYGEHYIYAPIMYYKNNIYSPGYVNSFIGKVQKFDKFIYSEVYNLNDKSLINSGLMIPLSLIDVIGDFNEKIKLDFSDYYFIEKYKKINQNIILLNLYIEHYLSGDERKNYLTEMKRYKYYCNGLKFFNLATNELRSMPALRRMLRLIYKYRSVKPIGIFLNYFIGKKTI